MYSHIKMKEEQSKLKNLYVHKMRFVCYGSFFFRSTETTDYSESYTERLNQKNFQKTLFLIYYR